MCKVNFSSVCNVSIIRGCTPIHFTSFFANGIVSLKMSGGDYILKSRRVKGKVRGKIVTFFLSFFKKFLKTRVGKATTAKILHVMQVYFL